MDIAFLAAIISIMIVDVQKNDVEKVVVSTSVYFKMLYNVSSNLLFSVTNEEIRETLINTLKDLDRSTHTITSMISESDEFVFDTFKELVESDLLVFVDDLINFVRTIAVQYLQEEKFVRRIEPLYFFRHSLYDLDKFLRQYAINQWSLASVSEAGISGRYLCVSSTDTLRYRSNKVKSLFSAGLIDLQNPHWFQQRGRSIMLIFNPEPEDILGMATDDANSWIGSFDNLLTWSLEKLLWYNELPAEYTLRYTPHYTSDAFNLESMLSDGEIILLERCKPVGVLIDGTYAAEFFSNKHNNVAVFADYYQLPVFLLTGNKEKPVVAIK